MDRRYSFFKEFSVPSVVLIPRVFAACDDFARKCWSYPLPLFFVPSSFLLETQGRNIDGPPWTKTANEPPVRKEPIYLFPPCLRASVVQRSCLWLRLRRAAAKLWFFARLRRHRLQQFQHVSAQRFHERQSGKAQHADQKAEALF